MKFSRKPVAVLVVAAILYSIFGLFGMTAYAAWMPVTISVDDFDDGTLTFHWSALSGAKSAEIIYHRPGTGDTAIYQREVVQGTSSYAIDSMKADYIYDISVTLYDDPDPDTGEVIGRGLLYYLPSISFTSSALKQESTPIDGGGRETGVTPRLELRWMRPKIYYDPDMELYPQDDENPDNGVFIDANSDVALEYMESTFNSIYVDNQRSIKSLNYIINISTHMNQLNSGSAQSSILIDQLDEDQYAACVSGKEGTTAGISGPSSSGFYSFELLGRRDETDVIDDVDDTDHILPDNDILPGTVYYMNIRPVYRDQNNSNVSAIRVGAPEDYNASKLMGELQYVSTPIRFQLTKDSANNIYVKIFRINQGSLDLPRFFYQIQAVGDDSLPGDWPVRGTLDDSYFSGDHAITVLTGVEPNNKVYYRIVVKSEGAADRLESPALEYTLSADTDRPPLPSGVAVIKRTLDSRDDVIDPSGTIRTVKSTDITLSWEKPLNWDEIKDDLSYHFLLSTSQSDDNTGERAPIYIDGKVWGRQEGYESKYRLAKYINADSDKVTDAGNRLEYTLDAFELFDLDDDPDTPPVLEVDDEGFPTFFVPNAVYYLQMYSTKAEDAGTQEPQKMSDRSVVISFTTLAGTELDVPLPMSFSLSGNDKQISGEKAVNYIDLSFEKVLDLDWTNYVGKYDESLYDYEIYYDIFMNSGTNAGSFIPVGTTQDLQGDIVFGGADDPRSAVITARVCQFTDNGFERLQDVLPDEAERSAIDKFGPSLLPNTVYYFLARTRLVVRNKQDAEDTVEKKSMFTSLLPVTTILLDVTPPDDSQRKPLAPTDFSIALDNEGEQLLSGSSVTFSWTRQQDDVIYQIIRTTGRIYPTAELHEYENDPTYTSFLDEYAPSEDGEPTDERGVYLDPVGDPDPNFPGKFTYDSATDICTFTVDRGMFPNKLYYFSLKAIRVDQDREPLENPSNSVWVSMPVTTSLIEPPAMLEAIPGAELGFFWTDGAPGFTAEDYSIFVKGPGDAAYKTTTKAQSTVIKDPDGQTYYGRITGLKAGTAYDIKVTKGSGTTVYEKAGFMTRDSYHEIEIKWTGKLLDDYAGYEIAIMEEGGSEYTALSDADLEWYIDKRGAVLPYYTEETARTVNNDSLYYHARIRSMNVRLPGGIMTKQPLHSNTKYYIKIRSVKSDPVEKDLISYSKYIGPVNIRTEFNQDDYDNEDREEQQRAVFLDRMEELEKGYFWRIAIGSNGVTSILLKSDRVADAMINLPGDLFTIDMSEISINIDRDEIYIPASLINVMKKVRKSLVIRTAGTELVIRPHTLDTTFGESVKGILERQEVKELYVKLDLCHSAGTSSALPSGMLPVSAVNALDVQALGFSMAYEEMAGLFYDKLYNEDTGLVSEKLDMLLNAYVGGADSAALIDQYTKNLIEMIERELSVYIDSTIKTTKLTNTIRDINVFDTPVTASLQIGSTKGTLSAYVFYKGSDNWQKSSVRQAGSVAAVDLIKTGTFVILAADKSVGGVPSGYWAEGYITRVAEKYDLEDVFPGIRNNFMPENRATCKDVVLLYEKMTGRTAGNTGLDMRTRLKMLTMENIIHPNSLLRDVNRQQTAAVLVKLFAVKKGLDASSLRPSAGISISDEGSIDDEFYLPVVLIVDIDVMQLDEMGRFRPVGTMTRAEVVAAFARLLELTGDI